MTGAGPARRATRWAAALLATLVLAVTAVACGDDDGGSSGGDGGDAEAFCERLQELDEADELDLDEEAAFSAFDELVDLAPDEIDSDLERLQDSFERLADLEDDPDAFEEAFEIILDPRLASSVEDFAEYAEDECGVEVEGADDFGDVEGDLSQLDDDLSSGIEDDPADDDEESPAQRLRAYLDENHPDVSDLASGIGTVEVSDSSVQATLTLDETVDEATALEVCEAVVDFAEDDGLDEIEIEVEDQEDTVLATGDLDGGCEAA